MARVRRLSLGIVLLGAACRAAAADPSEAAARRPSDVVDPPSDRVAAEASAPTPATAAATPSAQAAAVAPTARGVQVAQAAATDRTLPPAAGSGLRRAEGMVVVDYMALPVPGDEALDLAGLHVRARVNDWLWLGVGAYAPLVRGGYGGFMAVDVGVHGQWRLAPRLLAMAGLAGGGGGGGRSAEQSKVLSGTGGFAKAYVGLGYDFGAFTLGVNVARMKFQGATIDATNANVFVQVPFASLVGAFERHGQPLDAADARAAADAASENVLSLTLDTVKQIDPQGSFRGVLGVADLQYSHYFAPDAYWFASAGVGVRGRPLYNHVIAGVGRRVRLSPSWSASAQIGVGSGGYAPDVIDTGAGLLVYPKAAVEYALTRDLGVALSAGYLAAPRGTSRNATVGLALNYRLGGSARRAAGEPSDAGDAGLRFRGVRLSLLQQTEFNVRYDGVERPPVRMLTAQADILLSERLYVPVQTSVAYNAYLGYPGYGELLAGLGLQTRAAPGDRVQFFGQLMGGTNVHGPALKASAGLHVTLSERWSLQLNAGRTAARHSSGRRFSADSVGVGLDYRFAVPGR